MQHQYEPKAVSGNYFEIHRIMDSSEEGGGGSTPVRIVHDVSGFYIVTKPNSGQGYDVPTNIFPSRGEDALQRKGVVDELKAILDKEFQDTCDAASRRMSEASASRSRKSA